MQFNPIFRALVAAGLATPALAQQAEPNQPTQRIEITGSSIKRIQSEGALPVQVIRAADLEKQGVVTAEQFVATLAANGAGINNLTSNQGGDFLNSTADRAANNGASNASLRGLGSQYTLVLLNGRRVATHGLSGKAVDLNGVPMAAVDRIEILKDGASAIYGTDAIGGVINFILKRDFTGVELSGTADVTQAGGGDQFRLAATFGFGSLDSSGFNVMASIGYDTNTRLRGSQRDFHNGYQPNRGLVPDTTGTPFATINVASGTALGSRFTIPGDASGTSYNRINLLALTGACNTIPNTYAYVGAVTGFDNNNASCTYDYGKDWSLMQPVDRTNLVSRANFKLGADTLAFVELVASRVESAVEYTPNQITTVARGANYPSGGPYYLNLASLAPTIFKPTNTDPSDTRAFFDATQPIRLRWRCLECGPRQQNTTADAYRLLAGMEGVLAGWDYKWGLSTARSKVNTVLGDGNQLEAPFLAAMESGVINPFLLPGQSQTPEALAAIEAASAKGLSLYGGKATTHQVDVTASKELFALPAGPLAVAFGVDVRKETFRFTDGSASTPVVIGAGSPSALDKVSRDVKALFTELAVPIVKGLEAQLAVRHDRYSDFGSTTNPKVALRWQPTQSVVLRGSINRGFHAPDFGALYGGTVVGQFNSDINDPLLCPNGGSGAGCNIRPDITTTSNPGLKPERSKQWSLGVAFSPVQWLSASVDLWQIELTDRIGVLSGQELIRNYDKYQQYVLRDPDTNEITEVVAPFLNLAGDKTRGIDVSVSAAFATGLGKVTAGIDGTYVDSFKSRFSKSDPFVERVGKFGDSTFGWDLHLRWRHTASVSLDSGPWTTTLTQIFKSGYDDEVDGYGSGVILQDLGFQKKVKSYTLYNLSASYALSKNTKLSGGINNLFDTDPPFSLHNVDNVAGAGWDGRVGDPRGRSLQVRLTHKF
jgi:iron complex outermembrane recepter protein